jgi:ubiquitin C-terminal hydrolase
MLYEFRVSAYKLILCSVHKVHEAKPHFTCVCLSLFFVVMIRLQCLSHATPLTRLFLSGNFRLDVNQSNPLGTGGKLAHAYEAVMKELWMRDAFGATPAATRRGKSTSPTALKRAIALFAPRFAGHLQHDAQEFLAYLLDGLHEDLNRIRQAPYVEMPDVTDGQNMHVAGARAWDAHRRRNDSLVMDTFYGQFKSTCVCPRCNRVSVSFDAFNHVSLEIPQQNAIVPVGVVVCRAPTGSSSAAMMKPIRYSVLMRQDSPIPDLKQELSKLCGIRPSHLHLCSVAEQEILCIYRDNQLVSQIKNLTVAYEAEPFSNAAFPSFHVIAKHKVVTKSLNSAIAAAEEDNDEAALADAVGTSDNDFIGIPILTSFPADSTCRQVFQHFWEIVQDKLPDGEMDRPEDMVQVRLRNGRGQPLALFPNHSASDATSAPPPDAEEDKEQEEKEKYGRTSLFPKDLDEPVVRFLGEAAIESFVSVWIEWNETICEANDCNFDVGRFSLVNNHPSWFEAEERQRAIVTRGVTLDQCFETFTKPERLDEHNMWYCSKCKDHVRAMKTMELWRLPNVLIVHLKRFEFKNVLRRDKLDTLVDFPLEWLDMSNHCASDRESNFVDQTVPAIYDLFAVTNHYGRMGFGHYTAFAREFNEDGISDAWGLFDDSSVRSVGDGNDSVVSPAAYVLFYRRRTFS